MEKIELQIKDTRKFQDLALLIDRPDFQTDFVSLKNECQKAQKYSDTIEETLKTNIFPIAHALLRKYKYPQGFIYALLSAGKHSLVKDENLTNCYSNAIFIPANNFFQLPSMENGVILYINLPLTRGYKKKLTQHIKKEIDRLSQHANPLSKSHPLRKDLRPDIRSTRDWYWKRFLHKTSSKEIKTKDIKEINTIDKAISNYSKLLKLII